jgi:hypothetical protein
VTGFLMAMIPETFLSSLSGNILQVLVVAILFGMRSPPRARGASAWWRCWKTCRSRSSGWWRS